MRRKNVSETTKSIFHFLLQDKKVESWGKKIQKVEVQFRGSSNTGNLPENWGLFLWSWSQHCLMMLTICLHSWGLCSGKISKQGLLPCDTWRSTVVTLQPETDASGFNVSNMQRSAFAEFLMLCKTTGAHVETMITGCAPLCNSGNREKKAISREISGMLNYPGSNFIL